MRIHRTVCLLATCLLLLLGASARADVITFSHTFTGTETLQGPDRLFRNGVPSIAPVQKPFPGTQANNPTFFATLALDVLPGSVVGVTITSQDSFSFMSIYEAVLNPANLALDYLGDAGFTHSVPPPNPLAFFSVTAPASGDVLIVGNSINGTSAIGHSFTVSVEFVPQAVPEPSMYVLMLSALALFGCFQVARRRRGIAAR